MLKYFLLVSCLCTVFFRLSVSFTNEENLVNLETFKDGFAEENLKDDEISEDVEKLGDDDSLASTETKIIDSENNNELYNQVFLDLVKNSKDNQKKFESSDSEEKITKLSFRPAGNIPELVGLKVAPQTQQIQYTNPASEQYVNPSLGQFSNPTDGQYATQVNMPYQPTEYHQNDGQYIDSSNVMMNQAHNQAYMGQQPTLTSQQQYEQQQALIAQQQAQKIMAQKRNEYFQSESYKNNPRRLNNTLREQRLKLLNDQEFLQKNQMLSQFIASKNMNDESILAAATGTVSNKMKNPLQERVRGQAQNPSINNRPNNYQENSFVSDEEDIDYSNDRRQDKLKPRFQLVREDEGIVMNAVKKPTTTTTKSKPPLCIDTTTTTTTTTTNISTAAAIEESTTEKSTTSETTTLQNKTKKNRTKKPANDRSKELAMQRVNKNQNNENYDDEGDEMFLTLSKKFDLREKQYQEYLREQEQLKKRQDETSNKEKINKLSMKRDNYQTLVDSKDYLEGFNNKGNKKSKTHSRHDEFIPRKRGTRHHQANFYKADDSFDSEYFGF